MRYTLYPPTQRNVDYQNSKAPTVVLVITLIDFSNMNIDTILSEALALFPNGYQQNIQLGCVDHPRPFDPGGFRTTYYHLQHASLYYGRRHPGTIGRKDHRESDLVCQSKPGERFQGAIVDGNLRWWLYRWLHPDFVCGG
jgi:hypothetical protein